MSDANGVKTLQESFNHLASGGKLVVYGMFYFCIVIYFVWGPLSSLLIEVEKTKHS